MVFCVKKKRDEYVRSKNPLAKYRLRGMNRFLKNFMTKKKLYIARCVAGHKKLQKRRLKQKKLPITPQSLKRCLDCLTKAGCSMRKQRSCRHLCTR